jgi:cytochrome b pre-mRNA-processing protein 3
VAFLSVIGRLFGFGHDPAREAAEALLSACAARALDGRLFCADETSSLQEETSGLAVLDDSFDGRFEALAAHACLILRRLRAEGPRLAIVSQAFTNRLFRAFDDAQRDAGTGDNTIARKVRKMGEAFYGRAGAYDHALNNRDPGELAAALARNIKNDGSQTGLFIPLAGYLVAADLALASQNVDAMIESGPAW